MHISKTLAILPILFAVTKAAPADDMENLRTSCETAANVLNMSLNNTMGINTSSLIQNVTWQVGASYANLNSTNSTVHTNNITRLLDSPYFDYVDSIRTLAEAVVRRGRIYHAETNLPVYNALQGLARAVQAYGMQLSDAGMISTNATIRTITAGSSLIDAESAWANNANYPGRRRSRRSTADGRSH